eukprot:7018042-Prymnesium_polylepis.1
MGNALASVDLREPSSHGADQRSECRGCRNTRTPGGGTPSRPKAATAVWMARAIGETTIRLMSVSCGSR